ncbi:MAG: metallophosphoesterase family protein [Rhodospirillales bacterium]|nr:metallophosphoesterase family protein [Rhodospirillales bacterium]
MTVGRDRAPGWAPARRRIEASAHFSGPDGPRPRLRKAIFTRLLDLFAWGLRLTPLHGRGVRNALDLRRAEFDVEVSGLPPSFDGYRILHVSDTHLDVLPDLVPAARRLLDGIEVDLLAVTGDVLGDHHAPVALSAGLLMDALRGVSVRGPRLAILGNHDSEAMADTLESLGFDLIINRSIVIERDGDRLGVTGLDDVNSFYTEAARQALGSSQEACRIALIHSAEMADHAAAAGYALYLAGHTHGGQICLPGGRPVFSTLTRCRHGAVGLWRHGEMIGYTNSGLGVAYPPVRFNCRGEVAIITLRRPR